MAKISIQEVSGEVSLKEMSRENRRNHEVAEKDPLWDNWYEVAEKYEPKTIIKEDDEPANSKRSAKKKRVSAKAKVRRQRRATRAKKAEIQRNAIEIVKNFSKRMEEDQKNCSSQDGRTSYCKRRGGSNVLEPKSQMVKAARILKMALKMDLIDESIKAKAKKIMILLGIPEPKKEADTETNAEPKKEANAGPNTEENDETKQQKVENIEESAA